MSRDDAPLHRYARAIERHWSGLADRTVVLSPRDFGLIVDWCERGVPLGVVREAFDEACARRPDGSPPARLSVVASIVEESWRTMLEGRLRDGARSQPDEPIVVDDAAIEAWRRGTLRSSVPSAVRRVLIELLDSLAAGEDRGQIDRRLDRALELLLPDEVESEVRLGVEQRLAPYRARLERAAFDDALRRALEAARRRALGLPRLVDDPGSRGGC